MTRVAGNLLIPSQCCNNCGCYPCKPVEDRPLCGPCIIPTHVIWAGTSTDAAPCYQPNVDGTYPLAPDPSNNCNRLTVILRVPCDAVGGGVDFEVSTSSFQFGQIDVDAILTYAYKFRSDDTLLGSVSYIYRYIDTVCVPIGQQVECPFESQGGGGLGPYPTPAQPTVNPILQF